MKSGLFFLVVIACAGLVFKFVVEPLTDNKKSRVPKGALQATPRAEFNVSTAAKAKEPVAVEIQAPSHASAVVNTDQISTHAENQIKPAISETRKRTQKEAIAAVQKMETEVFDRAANLFSEEPIDYPWATEQTEKLRLMFDEFPGLERVSLQSLECRMRSCQIIAYTPQNSDADYFTAMVFGALKSYKKGNLNAPAAIARQMSAGQTSVYIARDGHSLEFYEE
ncbi:MAG: hypothetical protein COA42_01885 [Alteromonadaceae bacterium]|nr:MAG: hypothetical protein COA42_01885 [Alteromonadaceae bacterium]